MANPTPNNVPQPERPLRAFPLHQQLLQLPLLQRQLQLPAHLPLGVRNQVPTHFRTRQEVFSNCPCYYLQRPPIRNHT